MKPCFLNLLGSAVSDFYLNAAGAMTLSNTVNIRIVGADGEAVLNAVRGVAISTGSACQAAVPAPSHVLTAMGMEHADARQCLRISFGRYSNIGQIEEIVSQLARAVDYVRRLS